MGCGTGRKVSLARIGGQILVNGYPRVRETFSHVEGYVEDLIAYAPYLTVREGIEYSAAMRLSKKVQVKERKRFAEEVIVPPTETFLQVMVYLTFHGCFSICVDM